MTRRLRWIACASLAGAMVALLCRRTGASRTPALLHDEHAFIG